MSDGLFGKAEGIEDGGGYDLKEIKKAMEVNEAKTGDEKGFEEVEPIFVQVSEEYVVREEEYEARSVIIEYDKDDKVVSVELL